MIGLPGGSSPEGPATTAGCLIVLVLSAAAMTGLVAILVHAMSFIK